MNRPWTAENSDPLADIIAWKEYMRTHADIDYASLQRQRIELEQYWAMREQYRK